MINCAVCTCEMQHIIAHSALEKCSTTSLKWKRGEKERDWERDEERETTREQKAARERAERREQAPSRSQ